MIKLADGPTDSALAAHYMMRHENAKDLIYNAETEEDVRLGLVTLFDLDMFGTLEKYNIDYSHPNLLIEIKKDGGYLDMSKRCKAMAQLLHYVHDGPYSRGDHLLPDNLILADKRHTLFFNTIDFSKYIIDDKYFKDASSPSKPHKLLERELAWSNYMRVEPYNTLIQYDEVWSELFKRGIYDTEHLRRS